MNISKELIRRKERIKQISKALEASNRVEALIGFGSLADVDRMDEFSDLDFLVVPKKEYKGELIDDINWLENIYPVALKCKFTKDGYKVLFEDGVLCDFGILLPEEIREIPHDKGIVIWSQPQFDSSLCDATYVCKYEKKNQQYIQKVFDLALVDIYVGLSRLMRGEKYSATKLIQEEALEKVLIAMFSKVEVTRNANIDIFQISRRIEENYPEFVELIKRVMVGYEKNQEAANELLKTIQKNSSINNKTSILIKTLINKIPIV